MEDVIANALIEVFEKTDMNYVSLETLMNYGTVVVRVLEEKDTEAVFLVSSEYTNEVIRNYSDYFSLEIKNGIECVCLKEDKTPEDLRRKFRAILAIDVLLAFIDEVSLKALGV